MLKLHAFHLDLRPSAASGERFHWFSSSGWVMWNLHISALLLGTTVCLYEGHPSFPEPDTLWRYADAVGATFLGAGAAYWAVLHEGRRRAAPPRRRLAPARARLDRLAARARGLRVGHRAGRRARLVVRDLGRHRHRERVPRRHARAADRRRRDAGALPRHRRAGLERGRREPRRRGRRARLRAADAVDAALLLGRCRRPALPRQLLRRLSRRLAPRRLAAHHAGRRRDRLRPQRRDAESARPPARHRRAVPRRRSGAARPRQPRDRHRAPRPAELDAALRRAARRATRSTTICATSCASASATASRRASCPTRSCRSPRSRAP